MLRFIGTIFGLGLIIGGVAASKEYGPNLFIDIVLIAGTLLFGFSVMPLLIANIFETTIFKKNPFKKVKKD